MRSMWKLGGLLALAIVASSAANAAKETVLYRFQGSPDGNEPDAPLMRDTAGNLYGTTYEGGAYDEGTVFKITPEGKEVVLYSFAGGNDGHSPRAGLIADAVGNLYGTTEGGGAAKCGTVFKLTPNRREKLIHTFACGNDGGSPAAGLVMDTTGNLYGTTFQGGVNCLGDGYGCGTVFKITPSGRKKQLHAFTGGNDGIYPNAPVVRDAAGNLYGTTLNGGGSCNCGVAFKLTPDGQETVLHAFGGAPSDGYRPGGGLTRDEAGNLYGATAYGGVDCDGIGIGCGTVYKITADGHETVLHYFVDKVSPWGELVRDGKGNLFGVTNLGGAAGQGSVFKLTPTGREVILHSFSTGEDGDGSIPFAGPILDDAGNLYGVTTTGGSGFDGYGTVFQITIRQ